LTPLLVALAATPRFPETSAHPLRRAFQLGLLAGVIYFTGTLYWITRVMAVYGGLQTWVAVLVNAALIVYLALFPALFALVMRRSVRLFGPNALLATPAVWVTAEMGRTYVMTGFPWVLLGYSQTTVLPIAQFASLFGVYGVSMLVAAVSASLALLAVERGAAGRKWASALREPQGRPEQRRRAASAGLLSVATTIVIVLGVAAWGSRRAASAALTREGDPIRVGLIQGNVDQGEKWNASRAASIFQDYLRMTRQSLREGAQLILWPESSTPFYFEEDQPAAEQVRTLARQARVPILIGSDQIEWRDDNGRRVPGKFFNAAFLIRPDGSTAAVYRKMHLVPFGEYVPLKRLLFFAAPLVEAVSDFSAGEKAELLPLDGHRISTAICYEIVYPNLVRQFVAGGSELLTTITNDAWFGKTSAPYQHFEQASMRAIEQGRYLVRSANTGISGIVDPYGRVLERTSIFQQTVLVGEARFLRASTFYSRHGDVLAYASMAATLLLIVAGSRRRPVFR
jgi:apolipoprotein N-acyltransferase